MSEQTTPATSVPEPMAYIGRASCGCIRMAIADSTSSRRVASTVAEALRDGLTVDRVTCEFVRATPWTIPGCATHPKQGALL